MPHIARVFRSGNSQVVILPKELRLDVDRVEITREGDALIVRPHIDQGEAWASLKNALERGFSDDLFSHGRHQPASKDRSELDSPF